MKLRDRHKSLCMQPLGLIIKASDGFAPVSTSQESSRIMCVDAVSEAEAARGSSIWDRLGLRLPFPKRYSSYGYGFRIRFWFFRPIRWIATRIVCRRSWRVIVFRNLQRIQRPRCNQTDILVSLVRSYKNLYLPMILSCERLA